MDNDNPQRLETSNLCHPRAKDRADIPNLADTNLPQNEITIRVLGKMQKAIHSEFRKISQQGCGKIGGIGGEDNQWTQNGENGDGRPKNYPTPSKEECGTATEQMGRQGLPRSHPPEHLVHGQLEPTKITSLKMSLQIIITANLWGS